jgi:hydrogenase/urease accessory protein HupE
MRVVIILMHNFTASTIPTNNQLIDVVTMCVGVCVQSSGFTTPLPTFALGLTVVVVGLFIAFRVILIR